MTVVHFRTNTGTLGKGTRLRDGTEPITETEYEAELADRAMASDAIIDAFQASLHESTQTDYDALVKAGIPEATAARLSGHTKKGA